MDAPTPEDGKTIDLWTTVVPSQALPEGLKYILFQKIIVSHYIIQ